MPQNLELKARISSILQICLKAEQLGAVLSGVLYQKDQYYRCSSGKLKLRTSNNGRPELIFYKRPDRRGARYSDYIVLPITDRKAADDVCSGCIGKEVKVVKKRHLYLYKNARIHVDSVSGIGSFLEFEVIVKYGKQQAQKMMQILIDHFQIKYSDRISLSYSDLLRRMKKRGKTGRIL
jgi:predicted adenylyl cyclase CyaB